MDFLFFAGLFEFPENEIVTNISNLHSNDTVIPVS